MRCLLGSVRKGVVHLNSAGEMIRSVWLAIPERYPGVELDTYVIMPNHMHGIVCLVIPEPERHAVGTGPCARPQTNQIVRTGSCARPPLSLRDVIQRFKSLTTARYRNGVAEFGWPAVGPRLWQRRYFDRVIRNRKELNNIRSYIDNNPLRWRTEWVIR